MLVGLVPPELPQKFQSFFFNMWRKMQKTAENMQKNGVKKMSKITVPRSKSHLRAKLFVLVGLVPPELPPKFQGISITENCQKVPKNR